MEDGRHALQDQVEEVEALQACYPDLLSLAPAEADTLRFAAAVASGQSSLGAGDVPALSGTLQLPDVQLGGAPVQLKFVLPRGSGTASLQVLTNAPRATADSLQQLASGAAEECARDGAPCLLVVADRLAQAAEELAAAETAEAAAQRQHAAEQPPAANGAASAAGMATQGSGSSGGRQQGRQLVLSRRCVWFHHIKNLEKRKSIVQWGRELGLGGWSKPGFPGIVLVEGAGCDIDEYLSRLRRLRWQAMAVRGEEDEPMATQQDLEAARRAPRGVQELGEEDMGRLAAAAKAAGMEELFLTALKLVPRGE